jgi:hypothetical protein
VFASTPNPEVCSCATPSKQDDCPHDNVSYDPGNYLPPFGWEQTPGMFCDDCGKEMEEEEVGYDEEMPEDWDRDPRDYEDPITMREELADEARNPL